MPQQQLRFTEIAAADCEQIGQSLAAAGADWHYHVLGPTCVYNPRPGSHAFLIENADTGAALCAFSPASFAGLAKRLVSLLHGADIGADAVIDPDPDAPPLVRSVRACVAAREGWHHHMMKPGCQLNPEPARYVITLERASRPGIETLVSIAEPREALKEIEVLYFSSR